MARKKKESSISTAPNEPSFEERMKWQVESMADSIIKESPSFKKERTRIIKELMSDARRVRGGGKF